MFAAHASNSNHNMGSGQGLFSNTASVPARQLQLDALTNEARARAASVSSAGSALHAPCLKAPRETLGS